MRSEGFPFIVGVWGWTCVRVVLVVSSSCRRRCVVNFSPLGGTHALRHEILSFKVWKVEEVSHVVFVFCVTGAILWKRVNASAWFFRGRRSIWWVSWKVAEASQKSYLLSFVKKALWNLKEVSHEMLVLALQTFKVRGHFRILRGRRKILEASCLKNWRSLAQNARFGSLLL